jgi:hypothetical protein
MEPNSPSELVRVADGGPEIDGIVFEAPSKSKVVVAVMDPARGPVFRTVHPSTLSERTDDGPDDRALLLLIRRTWKPVGGAARAGGGVGRGRSAHTRGPMHRTTGK